MNFEKLNSLQNERSNDLKTLADGQTTQSKHDHLNSLGRTSAQDANAQARTPCFVFRVLPVGSRAPL